MNSLRERLNPSISMVKQKINSIPKPPMHSMNKQTFIDFISNFKYQILILMSIIAYIVLAIIIFNKNPYKLITKHNTLSITFTLFGALILLILLFFVKGRNELYPGLISTQTPSQTNNSVQQPTNDNRPTLLSYTLKSISTVLMILFAILFIGGIIVFLKSTPLLSYVLLNIVNISIAVIGFTIFYTQFKHFFNKKRGPLIRLFFDIIIYIPCLITDFINFIKEQYKLTTKPISILLILELLLILMGAVLPKIFSIIIKHNGNDLLKEPVSLTQETRLGNFDILNKQTGTNKFNYNYALSFWIYLDAEPPSTNPSYIENANILSYGGKPAILYNALNNELIVTAKVGNEDKEIYKTKDIEYQKWFNIIINYNGGTMDIFINNNLVSSSINVVPYMKYDDIVCGKQNGIYGFIKNVMYFNNILSKDKIAWIFKSNK
jgi:hypothetical protein